MINLLPLRVKHKIFWDQTVRFMSVSFIFISLGLLLLILFSLPVSILEDYQLSSIREDKEFTVEVENQRKEREVDNADIQNLIKHIESYAPKYSYWSLIEEFDTLAQAGIFIDSFDFNEKNEVVISGISENRSSLSDFRDELEANKQFKTVELPLSSLATEINTPFTIKLKLN